MGTRNIIVVKLDKKVRVAQYCQCDGYLSGQGKQIADFIDRVKVDKFKLRVAKLKPISTKDLKAKWVEAGADPNSTLMSFDVSDRFKGKYPEFSRDTGAVVLDLIYAGQVDQVQIDNSFKSENSWLEFVYILDLDKETLEIFTGHAHKNNLFKKLKFSEIKADTMEKLEKELN